MNTLKIALLAFVISGFTVGIAPGDAWATSPITGFDKTMS